MSSMAQRDIILTMWLPDRFDVCVTSFRSMYIHQTITTLISVSKRASTGWCGIY
jgi:hypothetical protein